MLVNIVTGYGLGRPGSISHKDIYIIHRFHTGPGTQQQSQWVPEAHFLRVNLTGL
jgi:hypothetical protein